jgi:hypothetical protein
MCPHMGRCVLKWAECANNGPNVSTSEPNVPSNGPTVPTNGPTVLAIMIADYDALME